MNDDRQKREPESPPTQDSREFTSRDSDSLARCPELATLSAVLDGTLKRDAQQRVEEHLAECDSCAQRLDKLSVSSSEPLQRILQNTRGLSEKSTTRISANDTQPIPDLPQNDLDVHKHLPELPGYQIVEELGRGGMGVVYRAQHLALDREVAIKMISDGVMAGPERIARFTNEAEAIAKLNHPQIVRIFDVGAFRGIPYFALEYAQGGSLRDRLTNTPWEPRDAALLVLTISNAVHAAHEAGIIHRDISPGNVLFAAPLSASSSNLYEHVRLSDFGLAHDLDNPRLTNTGAAMGTPHYLSPEQASAEREKI
ncbi:MAG: protein kinase, partial [Planctomycetota bacterium]